MSEDRAALIRALTEVERLMRSPRTQEDQCAIVARVTIGVRGKPRSETELFGLAWGNAQGLFGETFDKADEGQRWAWIDMCEAALGIEMKRAALLRREH
jgi:hypothetical protein